MQRNCDWIAHVQHPCLQECVVDKKLFSEEILQPHPLSKPLDICQTPDRGWWSVSSAAGRTSAKVMYGTWLGDMWCFVDPKPWCKTGPARPAKIKGNTLLRQCRNTCSSSLSSVSAAYHSCSSLNSINFLKRSFVYQGIKGRGVIESILEMHMLNMTVHTLGSTVYIDI